MPETGSSQVPCGVEHFIHWPKVCKEVSCAVGVKHSLHKTVFIFNFVTTILKNLFNIFNVFIHCFAYLLNRLVCPTFLLVGLGVIFSIIGVVFQSPRTQLFRKDFHTGVSS